MLSFGAQMVVDDVQNDGQAAAVALGHETRQPLRAAVGILDGEGIDAVIPPVPPARELGHRHELDGRHAELPEVIEVRHDAIERALPAERADV